MVKSYLGFAIEIIEGLGVNSMSKITNRGLLSVLAAFALLLTLTGCGNVPETRTAFAGNNSKWPDGVERIVSSSPKGDILIYLGSDNNLFIYDNGEKKVIYRNYEKNSELLKHPYSLWASDEFRIQWSKDGRYAYIIDSIYDVKNDRLINLKDCLVFSWIGNKGIYLAEGKLIEGKFWNHGFYGLYTSKKIKMFEEGSIKIIKQLTGERYFVVSEDSWNSDEKSLFQCQGSSVELSTARLKFGDEQTYDRLIKAYQELREDNNTWELLEGKYISKEEKEKALEQFEKARAKYPVKLLEEPFLQDSLNWDFDMNYYLIDIKKEQISITQA